MKWTLQIAAAILVCGSVTKASAAEWWIVLQRDSAGNVHFADTSQIVDQGTTITFWSHLFYKAPVEKMKSARIQYEVDCARFSIRERRYLDFDETRQVIDTGDNTSGDGWKEVAPQTSGAAYVSFACATPAERKSKHLSVDEKADIFDVADFFLDPSPIVEVPGK